MTCEHRTFAADTRVGRVERHGSFAGFAIDVRVRCSDCGLPFKFVGIPQGTHIARPRVSGDGAVLRAPIKPVDAVSLLDRPQAGTA